MRRKKVQAQLAPHRTPSTSATLLALSTSALPSPPHLLVARLVGEAPEHLRMRRGSRCPGGGVRRRRPALPLHLHRLLTAVERDDRDRHSLFTAAASEESGPSCCGWETIGWSWRPRTQPMEGEGGHDPEAATRRQGWVG
ncbi:hypothetical protein PVAP13_5NG060081 [Panicum virgatum]|uniref:Uncharacterized protein n=1 Tax=Panicum virgatum TaxID=38727 RepID=A0A8T0RQ23_PANVG|nr:hypothetical protein PVAP13_5NG060081 [Panicum virgatum]